MFLALQSKFLLIILISNKFLLLLKQYIFIYLVCWGPSVAHGIFSCGTWGLVPDQGSNPNPLRWEHGVLATGLPKVPQLLLI